MGVSWKKQFGRQAENTPNLCRSICLITMDFSGSEALIVARDSLRQIPEQDH